MCCAPHYLKIHPNKPTQHRRTKCTIFVVVGICCFILFGVVFIILMDGKEADIYFFLWGGGEDAGS